MTQRHTFDEFCNGCTNELACSVRGRCVSEMRCQHCGEGFTPIHGLDRVLMCDGCDAIDRPPAPTEGQ